VICAHVKTTDRSGRPMVAFCRCGESFGHPRWCSLKFLGIVAGEKWDRFDVRRCTCGRNVTRPLPMDGSVCIRCSVWVGPSKTATAKGVLCGKCAATAIAAGDLRCVG